MATSKVRIISNAFVLLGERPINNLDNNNITHVSASSLYEMILPDLIESGIWNFARTERSLSRLNETPEIDTWEYIYLMPQDPKLVLLERIYPMSDFEIFGNKIYSNEKKLSAVYLYIDDDTVSNFSPSFERYVVNELASELAMQVTQNPDIVNFRAKKAEEQRLKATQSNAWQKPSRRLSKVNRIYEAHFSTGYGVES